MKLLTKIAIFSLFLFSLSYSGTLLDRRDGQTYATVKIGDLEWMAENLKYKTKLSLCYDDLTDNCYVYGRLYNWYEAKKACPDGWRLPSESDFASLPKFADDEDPLGKKMKSASKWDGSNELGFNAVPGGAYIYNNGEWTYLWKGLDAFFWSSSKNGSDSAFVMQLESNLSRAFWVSVPISFDYKMVFELSVRCVKNKIEVVERNEPTTNYQEETVSAKPTAICRDGTPSYSQSRSGTCAGHGGVEKWMNTEEEQNVRQKPREVEKRYEQPTYYREENSASQPTAICADGTPSYSQGRGTCSHHDGVKEKTNSEKKQKSNQNDLGVGSLLNLFF